jgi:hypothetical protein
MRQPVHLVLGSPPVGDVLGNRRQLCRLAVVPHHERVVVADQANTAVGGQQPQLAVAGDHARLHRVRVRLPAQISLLHRREQPEPVLPDHLVPPPAHGGQEVIVGEHHAASAVERNGKQVDVVEHLSKPVLGSAQRGDVLHHALHHQRASVGVRADRVAVADPHRAAVGGDQPVLGRVLGSDRRLPLLAAQPHQIVRVQDAREQAAISLPQLERVAQQPFDVGADPQRSQLVARRVDVHHHRQCLDQAAQRDALTACLDLAVWIDGRPPQPSENRADNLHTVPCHRPKAPLVDRRWRRRR